MAYEVIKRIKDDVGLRIREFSNKSLVRIADMCNISGYGAARLFLAKRD